MKIILTLAIIAGLFWYGYTSYQEASQRTALQDESSLVGIPESQYEQESTSSLVDIPDSQHGQESTSSFSCDGRTHCSQMTSCAEATFFIQNCPNTKMDGNNDGVPCEKQWCS